MESENRIYLKNVTEMKRGYKYYFSCRKGHHMNCTKSVSSSSELYMVYEKDYTTNTIMYVAIDSGLFFNFFDC